MVHKRTLPGLHNPLIEPEHTPQLEILVERRRLGQTDLAVKPGQVGITNATRAENLGVFDYVHLRVPLPKDLKGSGIFSLQRNGMYPESYFLMRRSSDGFISATGMFKAAFPWSSLEEEHAERKHHKSLPSAGPGEVAGNVWISPEDALELADEYDMRPWIVALLDPEPIEKGTRDKDKHDIATPPRFVVPNRGSLMPDSGRASTRTRRELRSASPSKIATPSRKIASPRKARTTRGRKPASDAASATSSALNHVVENGTQGGGSAEPESVDGDTVTVVVDETVERTDDVEVTSTTVKVELPAHHPDLPLPESAEDMIAKAKQMVEEANKLEGSRVNGVKALKRKADELEEEDEDEDDDALEVQPVKKARVLEEDLKKERVKARALVGLSATLAIGALIPYFF